MNDHFHNDQRPAVLHLIDTGGPGGAETLFAQFASQMDQRGTRSVTVVPREQWLSGQLRHLRLEPIILPASGSFNLRYLFALVSIARRNRVKLIHTHLLGSAVYGALVGILTRTPVIAVLHGPTDLRKAGSLESVKRWLLVHACSVVVAVSTSTRDALIEFGVRPELVVLIPNGVDTQHYSPGTATDLRNELGLAASDLLIGAVGNIRKPKAYDILLQAAAKLLPRAPHCHFAVIGEGNDEAMRPLLALREQLGIARNFHFLGFRKSTPDVYRNFDAFVSSSSTEGLSLAFLEAMSSGRAVVATRSGGPQEVIESGATGVLTPTQDPDALAEALYTVVSDSAYRARLGVAARNRVATEFSLESALGQYAAIYHRLLAHR